MTESNELTARNRGQIRASNEPRAIQSCVRIASARYSVPTRHIGANVEVRVTDGTVEVLFCGTVIAANRVVFPGETSILDEHYGGPRPAPARAPRPKTGAEKAFCALGPAAEALIKGAAATGNSRLTGDLAEFAGLEAAHGPDALVAAVERAVTFGRYRAGDVRSILAAGTGLAKPARPGNALVIPLPSVATRPLSDYAIGQSR